MRFAGKTAIVTGGSKGIGFATAKGLAAEGAAVVVVARRRDAATEAVEELSLHGKASYVAGDVAEEATAREAVAAAVEKHGGLDMLVCNAGVLIPGVAGDQPLAEVRHMLETNLFGAVNFVHQSTPHLAAAAPSSIVVVSSSAAGRPVGPGAVYSGTKSALDALVKAWAMDLTPNKGIRVNGVAPGGTRTPLLKETLAAGAPEVLEGVTSGSLIKRLADPSEVARHILTLLDEESASFVTGAVWNVDGGYELDRARLAS